MSGNQRKFISRCLVMAVAIFVLSMSWVYPVTLENQPESMDTAIKMVKDYTPPQIPDKLNGTGRNELKGYRDLADSVEKGRAIKCRLISYFLIYPELRKRMEKVRSYMKDTSGDAEVKHVFGEGFKPLSAEDLLSTSTYELSDADRETIAGDIQHHLKVLDSENYESFMVDDNRVDVKRTANFYSNAIKKTENKVEYALDEFRDYQKTIQADLEKFYANNAKLQIQIGDTSDYSGIKKNFDRNSPIVINVKYWSQGVTGNLPLTWKILSPKGGVKAGETSLQGGREGAILTLIDGKIPAKSALGEYRVEVTAGTDKSAPVYRESYNVGDIPCQITRAFVLDINKKAPQNLKPGDSILLVIRYKPRGDSIDKATFSWQVYAPDGDQVDQMSLSQSLKLRSTEKDVQTKYIKAVIPRNAVDGIYQYQAKIKIGESEIKSEIVKFRVGLGKSGLNVKILANRNIAFSGDPIHFNCAVSGGQQPYDYHWQSDSGSTSTEKEFSAIFYNAGRRWVALSVKDSTLPEPLRESATRYVKIMERPAN